MYTTPSLRRLLSLVLLLAFGLPTAAPAFGLTAGAESALPACCRRAGAHHCAMSFANRSSAGREALTHGANIGILTAKCPCCPAPPTQLRHLDLAFKTTSATLISFTTLPQPLAQTTPSARAAEAGARHQRGPPAVPFS